MKRSAKDAIFDTVAGVTLRTLPKIPDRVKRLLLGGRSVTVDGNTLDTTLQLMLAGQRLAGMTGLSADGDPAAARAQMGVTGRALVVDIPVDVTELSIPGPAGPIPARHYRGGDAGAALLVYYHGGGFVIGDLESHDGLCRRVARDARVHVLSVDYRLAPEHKAPAAVEDAMAAYRWALDHAAELGADPARVAVGGDSAGGNLAAVVTQQARDTNLRLPVLQWLIYPWTNLSGETRSMTLFGDGYLLTKADLDSWAHEYLDGADVAVTDPRVSPLLADDLAGLSPAVVVTGGFDPLRDEGNAYAEALRAAGVAVDVRQFGSLVHGFVNLFPIGGGSDSAVDQMTSALRAHLARA